MPSKRTVENPEYAAFVRRILGAHARRVAAGDIEALPEMVQLAECLDDTIRTAVIGLRRFGYSWSEIADRLGISRQAAHQRWATKEESQ